MTELASLRALIDEARTARDSSHAQLQALHVRVIDIHNQAVMELPSTTDTTRDVLKWIIAKANVDISIENSDGWLQQHDAEVRAQERERCIKATRKTCQECYGLGKVLILHDVGRTEERECARCSVLAAAIQTIQLEKEEVE